MDRYAPQSVKMVLGNKADEVPVNLQGQHDGTFLAYEIGAPFLRISALDATNTDQVLELLTKLLLNADHVKQLPVKRSSASSCEIM